MITQISDVLTQMRSVIDAMIHSVKHQGIVQGTCVCNSIMLQFVTQVNTKYSKLHQLLSK